MKFDVNYIRNNISIFDVISRDLPLKKEGQEKVALCPFHKESTPSFKVNDAKGIFHCFGCGEQGDVIEWMRLYHKMSFQDACMHLCGNFEEDTQRMEEIQPQPVFPIPAGKYPTFNGTPDHIYVYRNTNGDPLYYIARYDQNQNRKRKIFIPYYYGDNKQWIAKHIPNNRPLFGLENISRSGEDGIVLLVEGEKCAIALQEMIPERAVLTWSGGSGTAHIDKTDWSVLENRKVVYWHDNDESGKKTIDEIVKHVGDLYIVNLPKPLPNHWDCWDAIHKDGWDKRKIGDLLNDRIHIKRPIEIDDSSLLLGDESCEEDESIPDEIPFPPELLSNIPGVPGKIAHWINKTSLREQPVFALGCAIATTGLLYAHKYKTITNLRSNMYIMGVGPTGCGKDHAPSFIKELLYHVGYNQYITGHPKSKGGLLCSLRDRGGKALTFIDELGKILKTINNKYSSPHVTEISTTWTTLYTSAHTYLPPEESVHYNGKSNGFTLEQPCLSIYGYTVPSHLYAAMTSADTEDGFLPRWLLFVTDNEDPEEKEKPCLFSDIPADFLTEIKDIITPSTTIADAIAINPKIIPFSKEALEIRKQFSEENKNNKRKNSIVQAFWTRASAHADKVALCCHEGDEISGRVMQWSIDLVKYCVNKMASEIQTHVAENEQEALTKRVLGIVRNHKKITKSLLCRKTQWLFPRQRDEILGTLIESGNIYKQTDKISGSQRGTEKYVYIPTGRVASSHF